MDSTIKVEYVTTLDAVKKSFWFKKFIMKFEVMTSNAIPLYYDNNGAIVLAKELKSHKKSKHIERRYHIIHDYLKKKISRCEE